MLGWFSLQPHPVSVADMWVLRSSSEQLTAPSAGRQFIFCFQLCWFPIPMCHTIWMLSPLHISEHLIHYFQITCPTRLKWKQDVSLLVSCTWKKTQVCFIPYAACALATCFNTDQIWLMIFNLTISATCTIQQQDRCASSQHTSQMRLSFHFETL